MNPARRLLFAVGFLSSIFVSGCKDHQGSSTTQVNNALSDKDRVPAGGVEKRPGDSNSVGATPPPTATP